MIWAGAIGVIKRLNTLKVTKDKISPNRLTISQTSGIDPETMRLGFEKLSKQISDKPIPALLEMANAINLSYLTTAVLDEKTSWLQEATRTSTGKNLKGEVQASISHIFKKIN
jgi:hypothetical protein